MDAPRELPQHTDGARREKACSGSAPFRVSTESINAGVVRRAMPADASAIAVFAPGVPPPAMSDNRATFLIEGRPGRSALIGLAHTPIICRSSIWSPARRDPREHQEDADRLRRSRRTRRQRAPGSCRRVPCPSDLAQSLGIRERPEGNLTGALARARATTSRRSACPSCATAPPRLPRRSTTVVSGPLWPC